MNSEPIIVEQESPGSLSEDGPGRLLSRKREALGLSVQEVAEALHITMHYVRSLEANIYEKLPSPVFIRGYIRTYASLLKLDPDVLVNLYNVHTHHVESGGIAESGGRSRRRRDKNKPWIIVSGIAFVGVALALWFFSSDSTAPVPAGQGGTTSPAPAAVVSAPPLGDGSPATIDNVSTSTPVTVAALQEQRRASGSSTTPGSLVSDVSVPVLITPSADISSAVGIEPSIQSAASAVDDASGFVGGSGTRNVAGDVTLAQSGTGVIAVDGNAPAAVRQAAPAATSSPADTQAPAVLTPESTVTTPAVPASLPSVNGVAPVTPQSPQVAPAQNLQGAANVINVDAGGQDLVQITFKGQSTVQVDDGNEKQIYSDVRLAGDVVRISGSAPFNILLSDAASTELSLNGNPVDFSASIRTDNSARLTIGL